MTETKVQLTYKDTIFRMLFKEKENLLSLYNAVNKSRYCGCRMHLKRRWKSRNWNWW